MIPFWTKNHSHAIALVRRQWSGNRKRVIKGIGVVTCVYVNPKLDRFWVIDYRIYAPETDGKTKLDHVQEMLKQAHFHKRLVYSTVLMDAWYATMPILKLIERLGKLYYCPIKGNRQVSLSAELAYQRVDKPDMVRPIGRHGSGDSSQEDAQRASGTPVSDRGLNRPHGLHHYQ